MAEDQGDWWNSIPNPARWLILGALLTSTGSGALNWNKDTSDRFKGADFIREIKSRDHDISDLKRRLSVKDRRILALEEWRREHTQHAATYTQIIEQEKEELEELTEEVHAHQRGGMHRK